MRRFALIAACAAVAFAGPALAGQPVALRADTASAGRLVTLGDLFEGAGAKASIPVANRTTSSLVLNARLVQAIAARAGLDWPNAEGLKTIVVHGGAVNAESASRVAAARGNAEILTYARDIVAGEILQPEDVVWGKAAAIPGDAAHEPEALIGMAAKRPLRAGAAALVHDVAAPVVVKQGEMITVTFTAEGVSLSLQGKALASAGVGETLSVENLNSKKTIQALVTGPGAAAVGPEAEAFKVTRSTRIASR